DIIGREDDLESIVGTLIDPNVQRDVSFLSIVGIGGLGKTTLAQLVYNDPRLWTCVADQDQQQLLDVKEIICKILGENKKSLPWIRCKANFEKKLAINKLLLVLDDVWTEIGGRRGSWIVVTTRSQETSRIIRDSLMYKLQGLSNENCWLLFERTAFGTEQSNFPTDLVKIGRDIVGGCARIPLAIRVVGSLLYGQEKSMWLSVRDVGLTNIRESQNDIMPILKLSYHHLESPLKSCFSFCAVFPKDFIIEKTMLINMWMAQGYIVPLDEGQSIEDAAEDYFSILLRRCFFQDI
ncbi:putative disease resistance protein RGA3, partial [Bienertia sinuspersici]